MAFRLIQNAVSCQGKRGKACRIIVTNALRRPLSSETPTDISTYVTTHLRGLYMVGKLLLLPAEKVAVEDPVLVLDAPEGSGFQTSRFIILH